MKTIKNSKDKERETCRRRKKLHQKYKEEEIYTQISRPGIIYLNARN